MHQQHFMNHVIKTYTTPHLFPQVTDKPFLLNISQNKPFTSTAVPSQYCVPKNISFLFSFVRFDPPPPKLPLSFV